MTAIAVEAADAVLLVMEGNESGGGMMVHVVLELSEGGVRG